MAAEAGGNRSQIGWRDLVVGWAAPAALRPGRAGTRPGRGR